MIFLIGCGNKPVEVPEYLLVYPDEPQLPEGELTNRDIVEWAIDLRSAYRETVLIIEAVKSSNGNIKPPTQ